jgi:hypothetical protein
MYVLACAFAVAAGCSTSSSDGDPDGGPAVNGDAGGGADVDDLGDDDSGDAGFVFETGPDVYTNPALPSVLLTAVAAGQMPSAYATVFQDGAWTALTMIGDNESSGGGGGVIPIANDEAVAVARTYGGAAVNSVWNGIWPTLYQIDTLDDTFVSAPSAAAPGAFVAEEASLNPYEITLDTFDQSAPTWSTGEITGASGDARCIPVVGVTGGGNPVVLYASTPAATTTYQWVARTGTTWNAAASVPGVATLSSSTGTPTVAAVTRAGLDQIVAVFLTGGPTTFALQSSTLSAGAWSAAPTVVATDVVATGFGAPFSLAAMPDGRVALAYVDTSSAIQVAFFDGTTWGPFSAVPSAVPVGTLAPLSIAHGIAGDVLELVFIDQSYFIRHARLTSQASDSASTWTAPVVVDTSQTYGSVSIASTP